MIPKKTARILIVDDEKMNLKVLSELLREDYSLVLAKNGGQSLKFARQKPLPDLILLDVVMPEMGGHDVIRQLKNDPLTKDIPVIFVTALSTTGDEEQGLKLGAVDYITKPFSPPIVKMRIHNHLRSVHHHRLLDRLAYLDPLTEIANRRRFDEELVKELSRAARNSTSFSVGMVDVDFFKHYNDHYGHAMGDRTLYQIAAALEASLERPGDLVARYGGEEFALILPETDAPAAGRVAEKARKAIENEKIPHARSSVSPNISVSVGTATVRFTGRAGEHLREARAGQALEHTVESLMHRADQHLYKAKQNGRNRIW
ncbi:MAG: diguanylate cyclase, partial [Desulfotignum sp.]|nr:diguanylate cyclase [Desulfotignum sp.]